MATRQEITDDLRRQYGNMLNVTQATAALGFRDSRAAKNFLEGVPLVRMEKENKYMAIDIARRIYDRMEMPTSL